MLCALLSAGQAALGQHRTVLARRERTLASLPFDSSVARSVVVSPDGTRGAYVKPLKGGSLAVVIDGNASQQPYDQVGPNIAVFSPDSRHVAFAGRRAQQWYVVVDGEEGEPFDVVSAESITFSPDGAHVAYAARLHIKSLVVLDGAAGSAYDRIVDGTLAFSPDSRRVAYVAGVGEKQLLVLGGVAGKAYDAVGKPRFSRDGQHVAYVASLAGKSFVILDGNADKTHPAGDSVHPLSLVFSPDNDRLAYVVGPEGKMRTVIGGKESKAYDRVFDESIAFSPDGRRVAYVAKRAGAAAGAPAAVVVVDGQEAKPHDGVVPGSLRFSPDGRRVAYVAEHAGADGSVKRCAVVDGAEGRPYDWVRDSVVFSPDGRHFAYVAERRRVRLVAQADGVSTLPPVRGVAVNDDTPAFESVVVVDGTEAEPYPWVRGDLVFTPDGGRLAYLATASDERFLDAGEIPADPANPAAGGRLVFDKPKGQTAFSPGMVKQPVKVLVVEEQIGAE
jgi:Tol biopolymer transport system component